LKCSESNDAAPRPNMIQIESRGSDRSEDQHGVSMTEIEFIESFLRENAGYACEKYAMRQEITVTAKRDANDLLTEVDLTLQKRAVDQIRDLFPGDSIVAEEGEFAQLPREPSGRCWVMDPIDGTNNFVRGLFPLYGISIGFALNGEAVSGGVMLPGVDKLLLAERGSGATLNGRAIKVSEVQSLDESRIDIDFSGIWDRRAVVDRAIEVLLQSGQVRCHGSAVASLAQVASGDAEAYVHMSLSPWDYAACQVIVEEAGGMATRHDGGPLRLFDGRKGVLITNGAIHNDLMGLIRA